MALPFINDSVGDLLNNYVHFITKQMQEIADALFGAENDNSNKPIQIPVSIQTRGFISQEALNLGVSLQPLADAGYYPWDYYNGMMNTLYGINISYVNGSLTIGTPVYVGKFDLDGHLWSYMTPGCEPIMLDIINGYVESHANDYIFTKETYPDKTILPSYYSDWSGNNIKFYQDNNGTPVYNGFKTTFPKADNTLYTSNEVNLHFYDFLRFANDAYSYVDFNVARGCAGTYMCQLNDGVFITNTNDQTFINDYITNNNAEHNYTYNYTTEHGDNVTVYYGDNYVITKSDPDAEITYNEYKDSLDVVVNKINGDNDYNIKVPTYNDNKFGPKPDPLTDDDYTDMGLGVETDGMAMYNMAVVTRQELFDLITDFESVADTGLSFIPHVLGLYKLGFESSMLVSEFTNDKIRLHKEPGKTAFNSAANYNIVKTQEVVIDCGSITVDREELLTNTFLDFSPYTTYEMFIPGCGWITLPDTIVGRTISVAIVFDLTTCSCKGVVRSEGNLLGGSGTTLATVNGIIGSSVPLSINETGLQRAAIMNGSTQAAMALGTAFMGVGIGNPYMGASGVAMAAGALASNHIAGNSTYTSTKGGATDYSVFGDGWKAVLKITRPVLEIPDNYGHSVGFVVNRYAQLNEFSGFTVCVNPHIHISATSDEKEEIKRLLEEGVILPEGE